MSVIKIHELPYKNSDSIDDNDMMIIEDSQDTKQITLGILKLFFSSDEKLNAIIDSINSTKDELTQLIATAISNMETDTDAIEARILNLFNDHEGTKRRLGNLIEQFQDALKRISNLETDNESIHNEITNIYELIRDLTFVVIMLDNDNKSNKQRLDNLEQDNEKNKQDIINTNIKLDQFIDTTNNTIIDINNKINEVAREAKENTNKAYDDLLRYIDYYHHISFNPPNFDEPYIGDPMVAKYIHPVGTIFETSDKNFEINKWFPGVWKYLGNQNSYNEEEQCVVDRYTWERIE